MKKNRSAALVITAPLLVGLALSPTFACSADSGPGVSDEDVDTHGLTFEEFKASVYKEPGTGLYIVNGDEVLEDDRALEDFYIKHVQTGALAVNTVGGVDKIWSATQKVNITYCVSKTFNGNYEKVKAAMATATADWAAAANVKFVYKPEQDGSCTANNTNVVFDVRPTSGQQYLARAFFPGQSRKTSNVLIDSSSFKPLGTWTLTGVLRHELGHVLGFRHEQTRPEAGTCYEDSNYRPLTEYDSKSVMHYPQCNGTNQGDLLLTDKDKVGAAALYGVPGGAPPPPPAGCAHDVCSTGLKLTAGCDPCVTNVCAQDSFCCNNNWDAQCVGEAKTICGKTCGSAPVCAHNLCTSGAKLSAGCDACAGTVCAKDSYCCNTGWDGQCVSEAVAWCGLTCN